MWLANYHARLTLSAITQLNLFEEAGAVHTRQKKGAVRWRGRSSPIMYIGEYIHTGVATALLLTFKWPVLATLFAVCAVVWFTWNGRSHRYELTATSIYLQSGMLTKEVEEVRLDDIVDFAVLDNWLLRLFSNGNVVFIVDESSEFQPCAKGIRHPEKLIKKMRTLKNGNAR